MEVNCVRTQQIADGAPPGAGREPHWAAAGPPPLPYLRVHTVGVRCCWRWREVLHEARLCALGAAARSLQPGVGSPALQHIAGALEHLVEDDVARRPLPREDLWV